MYVCVRVCEAAAHVLVMKIDKTRFMRLGLLCCSTVNTTFASPLLLLLDLPL